jgi:outer membrane protein OmpA-like peptidoglycan-associated protein
MFVMNISLNISSSGSVLRNPYRSIRVSVLILMLVIGSSVMLCAQPLTKQAPYSGRILIIDSSRVNLGPLVNSKWSDLFPVISPDEGMLFFTRKGSPDNTGFTDKPDDEDIWYSMRLPNGTWGQAKQLEGPLNTKSYDGVRAVNSSLTRLYLQNQYHEDGSRSKGFSVSQKGDNGEWGYPDSLEIDNYYNDTNTAAMTVSTDEKYIIFSLQRHDTKGQHDLYISHCLGGRKWSEPKPIEFLNTSGDEISPFIAYDDKTLYFSTNGRGGLGSQDIFMSRRLDDSWQNWSTPQNLGAPINTIGFDAYFMLSANGDTCYFSSSQGTSTMGYGKSDIWKMAVPVPNRPGFRLQEPFPRERELAGATFRLDGVLFDVDRSSLKTMSHEAMDKLVALLQKYPKMEIEVQGHTDADGSPEHNFSLSEERANKVRSYLVEHGIAGNRVDAKGYGMTLPIAPNTTTEGKKLNRRVMIKVKVSDPSVTEISK